MEITLSIILGVIVVLGVLILIFEFRIRQPDVWVLYETRGISACRSSARPTRSS